MATLGIFGVKWSGKEAVILRIFSEVFSLKCSCVSPLQWICLEFCSLWLLTAKYNGKATFKTHGKVALQNAPPQMDCWEGRAAGHAQSKTCDLSSTIFLVRMFKVQVKDFPKKTSTDWERAENKQQWKPSPIFQCTKSHTGTLTSRNIRPLEFSNKLVNTADLALAPRLSSLFC